MEEQKVVILNDNAVLGELDNILLEQKEETSEEVKDEDEK